MVSKARTQVVVGVAIAISSPLTEGCLGKNDTVLQPDVGTMTNSASASSDDAGKRTDGGSSQQTVPRRIVQAGGSSSAKDGGAAASGGARATSMSMSMSMSASGTSPVGRAGQTSRTSSGAPGDTSSASAPDAGVVHDAQPGEAPSAGADDPDCDLTGTWIAKQITISEAIGVSQFSNNWFYFELEQSGASAVVKQHFDCGIEVRGTVTVTLPRNALEAQLTHNVQIGRTWTVRKDSDICTLTTARFWSIRGAEEPRFLPDGVRDSEREIRDVAAAQPLPTPDMPDGATDPDGDGTLGLAFEISGLVSGVRNSVQRDWTRWFTEPGYEIAASVDWSDDQTIRADFDNEESVIEPRQGVLSSGSTPKTGAKHVVRLRFLGRDPTDARRAAIVKDDPIETCYAIQDAMPAEALE